MAGSVYVVYAVDSADRLTLLLPPGAPTRTKAVLLSYIQVPKPARKAAELIPDEPCAGDALELIRAQCIGKQVTFIDDVMIEPLQRMSGRLILPNNEDAAVALLKAGLATVSDRLPPRMDKALHEEYLAHQALAKAAKLGLWSPKAKTCVRPIKQYPPPNFQEFVKSMEGKQEKVRVEKCRTGHAMLLSILSSWQQLQVVMTAIHCPNATKKDKPDEPDPVGSEALAHTERFLLHRNVTIKFEGLDPFGNMCVSVVSSKGMFQEELLKRGLATTSTSTMGNLSQEGRDALRAAEKVAQDAKIGVWVAAPQTAVHQSVTATGAAAEASGANAYSGKKVFEGLLVQVLNGDTVFVRDDDTKEAVKVQLACVRANKTITRDQGAQETRVSYEEYSWEAKEFLRTRFIGKRVAVNVDFGRTFEDTKDMRAVGTVTEIDTAVCLNAAVVGEGLAKYFLGRNDSSICSTAVQDAEALAKQKGLGIFSDKPSPVTKVVELYRLGENKGKYYLSFLQRGMQGNKPPVWKGVVENVLSGGSMRIYISKEHFQITVKLAGIIAPSAGGPQNDAPDRFAAEAKDFAMCELQQRDVEVAIDTVDRGGNFIGMIVRNGKNFACSIVEAGLATVANADRLPYASALVAAEKAAQEAKKYIWSSEGALPAKQLKQEHAAQKNQVESFSEVSDPQWAPAAIADVIDGNTITLTFDNEESRQAQDGIQEAISRLTQLPAVQFSPKKGEHVIALFREDKSWNRAKVLTVHKDDGTAEVLFIDFGNKDDVKLKDIRPIPKNEEFSILTTARPLAQMFKLSFLKKMAVGHEYCDRACDAMWEFAQGPVVARKDMTSSTGVTCVSVALSPNGRTMSQFILEKGLGLLDKRQKLQGNAAEFAKHENSQQIARREHCFMWKFGDADDDDE